MKLVKLAIAVSLLGLFSSCAHQTKPNNEWHTMFNGKDLDGWTVKVHHHDVGVNFGDTFRVENGLLRVSYNRYDKFNEQYAHLYYDTPFTNFHIKIDYRFYGDFLPDAPRHAERNSGVMYYSQSPYSVKKEQNWPISVEMQFLAGLEDGKPRPTGNMCSPGTNIEYQGSIYTEHCLKSSSPTMDVDEWVSAELIVKSGQVTHIINGEIVLQYNNPTMGGRPIVGYDRKLWIPEKPLTSGYIALQSEGHPIEFRNIEIKALD